VGGGQKELKSRQLQHLLDQLCISLTVSSARGFTFLPLAYAANLFASFWLNTIFRNPRGQRNRRAQKHPLHSLADAGLAKNLPMGAELSHLKHPRCRTAIAIANADGPNPKAHTA